MENEEIWVPVKGYEGLYEVSNLGNVRSLNYNKTGMVRNLKPNITRCGYHIVHLNKPGQNKGLLISRLVCAAFHPNPNNLPCVNHIDEDKSNNRAENLEWCTYSYNSLYGTHRERMLATRKANNGPKAEKPVVQLSLDGVEVARFRSSCDAERKTGAMASKIRACCNGKRKQHFGYKWRFAKKERG